MSVYVVVLFSLSPINEKSLCDMCILFNTSVIGILIVIIIMINMFLYLLHLLAEQLVSSYFK